MIGGMTPPCAIALATMLFPNKFTKQEREAGPTNFIMGLAFITEGAIPYAASDPLHVIPACVIGSGIAGAYPPSSASATSGKLLLKHATSIKQYVSFSNHSTIYFYCQSNSSKKSILLTDTSYATLFSVCVSDNFLTYSRLWILPQICTCPPTSKPEANLAFRPQQMHGM